MTSTTTTATSAPSTPPRTAEQLASTAADIVIRSDKQQLRDCLEAFAFAHQLADPDWPVHYQTYFARAGITSIQDLATATRDGTVNLDLDFLADVPPSDRLSDDLILKLNEFLPGPVGVRCFRLAQRAAEKVETGQADAKYVHRPESGQGRGDEHWNVSNDNDEGWTLHVDCAGFVRSTLKHVLSHIVVTHRSEDDQDILTDAMPVALSDRSFMRAKDFYRFFESIPTTVLQHDESKPEWRIVPDLRVLIAGDVVVYRPRGSAAGGAAFTSNDRSSLKQVLKAVKAAELWRTEDALLRLAGRGYLVKRNVSRDPRIKPWVEAVRAKLASSHGITTVKQLRAALLEHRIPADADADEPNGTNAASAIMDPTTTENSSSNSNQENGLLTAEVLRLMNECVETTALNTGHIVFVAGQPKLVETTVTGNRVYRVPVVHSTKHGKKDDHGVTTQGVQMHYRRFTLTAAGKWIRESPASKAKEAAAAAAELSRAAEPEVLQSKNNSNNSNGGYLTDDDDAVVEGPDEDDEGESSAVEEETGDDLAGLNEIEILAARMSI